MELQQMQDKMADKYKFLYQEETNKLFQNMTISSTMNQSINNFLVIQTFITSVSFYLSKYYLDYLSLNNAWYVLILILWSISCFLNIIILCRLISHLFSIVYALPLFDGVYSNKLTQYIQNGGKLDAIYKDWFEIYREMNFSVNFFREGKIRSFKKLKILAIVSLIFLTISSLGLGYYIHNNKEVMNVSAQDKNNKEQNQKKTDSQTSKETTSIDSTSTKQQTTDSQNILPSAKDQIRFIVAAKKPDVKKVIKISEDARRENDEKK